jgi:hypothetical protein
MASSGNFCIFNRLPYSTNFRTGLGNTYNGVIGAGNTQSYPGNNCTGFGTMALTTGKKWYMEGIANNAYNTTMGIFELNDANLIQNNLNTTYYGDTSYKSAFYHRDGNKYIDGSSSSYGATFTTGDIIGMAVDLESGTNTIEFFKNNSSQGSFNLGTNGLNYLFCVSRGTSGGAFHMNWGQDSTFAGTKTAGNNTDDNGFGDFFYAPPSGFLALCSANLGISADIDPAQTDDNFPQKQFNIVTYTGNSTTGQSISGLGFKPDLIWAKMSSSSQNNMLFDTNRLNSRGTPTPFMLRTDSTAAEIDDQAQGNNNPMISSFDNDGFTLGTSGSGPNDNTREYVAWCWRANGGVTSTNNDGTITSTVQANQAAGFSIVTYTGGGSDGTVGHGLTKAPEFVISKRRNATQSWYIYHKQAGLGYLDFAGNAFQSGNVPFNDAVPTSSVVGASSANVLSGSNYIYYCWHGVEGYSAFGKYNANDNADGPFQYCGFRPRLLVIKKLVSGDGWGVWDSERGKFNVIDNILNWHLTNAESSNSAYNIDFVSNGFKIRSNNAQINHTSYDPYVWVAWGDVPFKYSNSF